MIDFRNNTAARKITVELKFTFVSYGFIRVDMLFILAFQKRKIGGNWILNQHGFLKALKDLNTYESLTTKRISLIAGI